MEEVWKPLKNYEEQYQISNAETFIPNPNCYSEINHKDWNKENNKIDNLEWCDRKYNANYGTKPIEKWKKDLMILKELRSNVVKNGNVLQNVVNNACE